MSPLFKNKKGRAYDHEKSRDMVPPQAFFEIHHRKYAKNYQGYDLLYGLELYSGKLTIAYAVGRDLKTVFSESDKPAYEDDFK
jgi:hypothetical protein